MGKKFLKRQKNCSLTKFKFNNFQEKKLTIYFFDELK